MPTSIGPDGIDVSGYGWTNQGTQFNSNKSVQSYGAPNSTLYNTSANNGYVGWSMIPEDAISSIAPAATTVLQLERVFVPNGGSVGHVDLNFTAAGTITVLWVGVYSMSGALLATTAESHAAVSTTALTPLALTTAFTASGSTNYYVGITATYTGSPTLSGSTIANAWLANANLTAATSSSATAGTNATLPSTITMSSNTATANKIWVGLRA